MTNQLTLKDFLKISLFFIVGSIGAVLFCILFNGSATPIDQLIIGLYSNIEIILISVLTGLLVACFKATHLLLK